MVFPARRREINEICSRLRDRLPPLSSSNHQLPLAVGVGYGTARAVNASIASKAKKGTDFVGIMKITAPTNGSDNDDDNRVGSGLQATADRQCHRHLFARSQVKWWRTTIVYIQRIVIYHCFLFAAAAAK